MGGQDYCSVMLLLVRRGNFPGEACSLAQGYVPWQVWDMPQGAASLEAEVPPHLS